jgi:hypothetical protein
VLLCSSLTLYHSTLLLETNILPFFQGLRGTIIFLTSLTHPSRPLCHSLEIIFKGVSENKGKPLVQQTVESMMYISYLPGCSGLRMAIKVDGWDSSCDATFIE